MKKPYYKNGNIELYLGDCLKALVKMKPESVDMIFADPPYNLSNGGFSCHAGKRVNVDKGKWDASKGVKNDFDFHKKWIDACKRVLKPNGTIWISGTYHSIYQCGVALQLADYHILNDVCWFKPNATPNLSCRFFTASHETLIWAQKLIKDLKYAFKLQHNFSYSI
jgi:site-specific DNA-methyltransferase (adenine-specific)